MLTANSVDFWFFSFSFDFGKRGEEPLPISLQEFYLLCEKSGPPDESPNSSPVEDLVVQLKFSLESGAFPMPSVVGDIRLAIFDIIIRDH